MRIFILFTLLVLMVSTRAQPQPLAQKVPQTITIHIHHFVGPRPLQLFNERYIDPFGEPFTIQRFRYYISKIKLWGTEIKLSGTQFKLSGTEPQSITTSDQSFLVDESDTASKTITLSTRVKTILSLSFVIGVDSVANFSGVGTGDLDPAKGMFWTWNSGYIYAKLEGQSDSSKAPGHQFTWDIGGYKNPANASREITLTIPGIHSPDIQLNVDILKWFDERQPIRLNETPVCHQPGILAMRIADNYAVMFSISP
jgi:hypothetical protein